MTLLYDKYAGSALIAPLVEALHGRIAARPELVRVFSGAPWQDVVKFIVALLSAMLEGPQIYRPEELTRPHFSLSGAQYESFCALLAETLASSPLTPDEQRMLLKRFGYLRSRLVAEPAESPDIGQLQALLEGARIDMQHATRELESARSQLLQHKDQEIERLRRELAALNPFLSQRPRLRELLASAEAGGLPERAELRELLGLIKELV